MASRAPARKPARRQLPHPDTLIVELDNALRTLFAPARSSKSTPGEEAIAELEDPERRLSSQLMRVNHAGEVCAQALYRGQMLVARESRVKALLARAAEEEGDHLAWTERRLSELGARKSVLNPLWYLSSFALGALSGLAGDRLSLGFLAETERQVERHLQSHVLQLPEGDQRSRAIVEQMKQDEAGHAIAARRQGGAELPFPARAAMQLFARVMTTTSRWL
jgi:ubiquinone biosynthesis monooxygenase Coq7